MRSIAVTFLVAMNLLIGSCSKLSAPHDDKPPVPPSSDRIAALLEFTGPVAFTRHIASPEELADLAHDTETQAKPIASFLYSDPAHTSSAVTVSILPSDAFLGKKRAEFTDWFTKMPTNQPNGMPHYGISKTTDGRSIYQFPYGMGPGGGAEGALLRCRDTRYEIVIIQSIDEHDQVDPKQHLDDFTPKRELRSVIEAIESLVFPQMNP